MEQCKGYQLFLLIAAPFYSAYSVLYFKLPDKVTDSRELEKVSLV